VNRRICLTPDEAFEVGFEEPCEHSVPDPTDCPHCRLSVAEIRRFAVLLRGETAAQGDARAA
jgi:hypothetical protein